MIDPYIFGGGKEGELFPVPRYKWHGFFLDFYENMKVAPEQHHHGAVLHIRSLLRDAAKFQTPHPHDAVVFIISLILYVVFLTLLTMACFEDRSTVESQLMVSAVRKAWLNTDDLDKVTSRSDTLNYIHTQLITPLFLDTMQRNHVPISLNILQSSDFNLLGFGALRMLSTMRLRQVRVKRGCHQQIKLFGECIPAYGGVEDINKTTFVGKVTKRNYTFQEAADSASFFQGHIPNTFYPASGHVVEADLFTFNILAFLKLNQTKQSFLTNEEAREITKSFTDTLIADDWLDESVRVLFAEVSFLQSHREVPMLASAIMMFEFPSSGGMIPTVFIIPFNIHENMTSLHIGLIVALSLNVLFQIGTILRSFIRRPTCVLCVLANHSNYSRLHRTPWYECIRCCSYYDCTSREVCPTCEYPRADWWHVCFLRGQIFRARTMILAINAGLVVATEVMISDVRDEVALVFEAMQTWQRRYMEEVLSGRAESAPFPPYSNFGPQQNTMSKVFAMSAVNVMISFLALYTYLVHIEAIGQFLRLFSAGASMICNFTLCFSVAFFGFAATAYLACGTLSDPFSSLDRAVISTFRLLTGDLGFEEMQSDEPVLAILLYIIFGVAYMFIGLNVFIAIVSKAHEVATDTVPDDRIANAFRLLFRQATAVDWARRGAATTSTSTTTYDDYVNELRLQWKLDQEERQEGLDELNNNNNNNVVDIATTRSPSVEPNDDKSINEDNNNDSENFVDKTLHLIGQKLTKEELRLLIRSVVSELQSQK
eukprot:PhM_4_TR16116/c0_g1_i2/m.88418